MHTRKRRKPAFREPRPPLAGPPAPELPSLESVCGMDKAKQWGLALAKDIEAFRAGKLPWRKVDHGCVLVGPPGTGKTTFVRILAAHCRVHLIETSYPAWQRYRDGHLGSVHTAIDNIFTEAHQREPSIIFIDEIGGIPSREIEDLHNRGWWDQIVNALIEGIDSIRKNEKKVIVIGACNFPDRIDPALLRSGRLDRMIHIDLPTVEELLGILRSHLKDKLHNADLRPVAVGAVGMTGADVERLVRDAERLARSDNDNGAIEVEHLLGALEDEVAKIPADCLERVAIHEAGHALAAILLEISDSVSTSLIRRGQSVASTHFNPSVKAITRALVEKRVAVALAGRAAEDVLLGDVTAGAGGPADSDLAVANDLAIRAVTQWGLSCEEDLLYSHHIGPDRLQASRPARVEEAQRMLNTAYSAALGLMRANRIAVRAVADALVKKRALSHEDIVALMKEE